MIRRRRPALTPAETLYSTLFDRVTLDDLDFDQDAQGAPGLLRDARTAFKAGRVEDAIAIWREITELPEVGSRWTLDAWRFLRVNGVQPSADLARRALGAIVERPFDRGWDVVAAYADGTARYLNHGGGSPILYEDGSEHIEKLIHIVVELAQQLANAIGTYTEDPLPNLPPGHERVTVLTPGGLRFGQGGRAKVDGDPLAGEVVHGAGLLAVELMKGVDVSR